MLTDKAETREKLSRIFQSETISTEILYCLGLVQRFNTLGIKPLVIIISVIELVVEQLYISSNYLKKGIFIKTFLIQNT